MSENVPQGCIPFDLEKYKAGHPARTSDGRSVKFVCHSPTHPEETARVMSMIHDGTWTVTTDGGVYHKGASTINDIFLVAPEPKWVQWDNVDEVPDGVWFRLKDSKTGCAYACLAADTRIQKMYIYNQGWCSPQYLFDRYEWHPDRRHKGPWNVCGKVK